MTTDMSIIRTAENKAAASKYPLSPVAIEAMKSTGIELFCIEREMKTEFYVVSGDRIVGTTKNLIVADMKISSAHLNSREEKRDFYGSDAAALTWNGMVDTIGVTFTDTDGHTTTIVPCLDDWMTAEQYVARNSASLSGKHGTVKVVAYSIVDGTTEMADLTTTANI